MADENGSTAPAPISNQIIQILCVDSDCQGNSAATTLKWFEHMPLPAQFPRKRFNVAHRRRTAMQNDY